MFTVTSKNVITQIEENGYAAVHYKVDGYWSSSQITVYINRTWKDSWNVHESHASGGEDSDFTGTNAERTANFAHAMLDASVEIAKWEKYTDLLNGAYEKYLEACEKRDAEMELAREKARKEREEADRKERIANPSMGLEAAVEIMDYLKEAVAGDTNVMTIEVDYRNPAARGYYPATAFAENYNGKTRFYISGKAYSRTKFVELLATEFVKVEETVEA